MGHTRHKPRLCLPHLRFALISLLLVTGMQSWGHAQTMNILYSFSHVDGSQPSAPLLMDKSGNLYGTTQAGGANTAGAVFELMPDGTEEVLYSFTGGPDGGTPYGGLVMDASGNLYGTTLYGGSSTCGDSGCGVVFEVTPAGIETVLYEFVGGSDGFYPRGTLIIDSIGNLYGTTQYGGAPGSFGTVFEISPQGVETVLYRFLGYPNDGAYPFAGVIRDVQGNLYGTTEAGGAFGLGTIYKLSGSTETIVHTFNGGADAYPWAGVQRDSYGNLYGTASGNYGEVYVVSPAGKERILHTFTGGNDGGLPLGALIHDPKGAWYSTTSQGGASGNGTIFRVTVGGNENVVYSFEGMPDGAQPYAGLIGDAKGNGYGTTFSGGANNRGAVFEISP